MSFYSCNGYLIIYKNDLLFCFKYNLRNRQEDDSDSLGIDLNDKLIVHHAEWTRSRLFGKLILLNCTYRY